MDKLLPQAEAQARVIAAILFPVHIYLLAPEAWYLGPRDLGPRELAWFDTILNIISNPCVFMLFVGRG